MLNPGLRSACGVLLAVLVTSGCISDRAAAIRAEAEKITFPSGGHRFIMFAAAGSNNSATAQVAYAYPRSLNASQLFQQLESSLQADGWHVHHEYDYTDDQGWFHTSDSIQRGHVAGGCVTQEGLGEESANQEIVCTLNEIFPQ